MKLSIIIPVYNMGNYISRCLDSLLDQDISCEDYEIIIIDDGTQDNSISIAKQYLDNYSNIIIHNQENAGVGAARNKGINLAKGDFIYFIDPDDYLASNVLKSIVSFCEDFNLEILTFSSQGTTLSSLKKSETDFRQKFVINKESGIDYIGNRAYKNEVWWYIIDRNFLIKSGVKFIEGRWMEDAIFTANLFVRSKAMAFLNIDAHRHVKTPNSAMTNREPSHYLKVIHDNENAAIQFKPLLEEVANWTVVNEKCINRLKTKQQSFVFFMMIRMLKSSIKLRDIRTALKNVTKAEAYPLNNFLGEDHNGLIYSILVLLFNKKYLYYMLFLACNPILNFKNFYRKGN